MTTQEELPDPKDCSACQDARNCTTKNFIPKILLEPLPQVDQTIPEYFRNLCKCGHQLMPGGFGLEEYKEPTITHTTMCVEHTIRWMNSVVNLKHKWNPEGYGTQLQP